MKATTAMNQNERVFFESKMLLAGMRAPATAAVCALLLANPLHAAYVLQIDTDGADNGALALNPFFAFGGDTTTAVPSSQGTAVGLLALGGGDSIFGGNGTAMVDTYIYNYTPSGQADNYLPGAGTAFNNDGDVATGLAGGGSGSYRVYVTWPERMDIGGGLTTYEMSHEGGLLNISIDQNATASDPAGGTDDWVYLGDVDLLAANTYTLSQSSTSNTFVSMRAAGVMFELVAVPEPSSISLLGACLALLTMRRKRA